MRPLPCEANYRVAASLHSVNDAPALRQAG
jgi:hypothetical protein